jgi:hypothetical protein
LHSLADFGDGLRIGIRTLQEAAVAAKDFFRTIAGQSLKPGAGKNNRIVRLAGVRNQDALGYRLDRPIP